MAKSSTVGLAKAEGQFSKLHNADSGKESSRSRLAKAKGQFLKLNKEYSV